MKALVLIGLIICFLETPVVFAEQTTVPSPTTIVKKPDWFKQPPANLPQNITTATRNNKQIILYFYQDSCPFCAKLLKHDFGNPDIANKTRQYFEVIPINMKGTKPVTDISGVVFNEADFAAEKDVLATPVLLFLDETGTEVLRINGYYPPAKFEPALDYVEGKHHREGSFKDYYHQLKSGTPPEDIPSNADTEEPC